MPYTMSPHTSLSQYTHHQINPHTLLLILTPIITDTHICAHAHIMQTPLQSTYHIHHTKRLTFEGGDLVLQTLQHCVIPHTKHLTTTIECVCNVYPRWGWVVVEVPLPCCSASISLFGDRCPHTPRDVKITMKAMHVSILQQPRRPAQGQSGVCG